MAGLDHHERIIDLIRNNVHKENGRRYTRGEIDSMCYDGVHIDIMERLSDVPLHFTCNYDRLNVEMSNLVTRVGDGPRQNGSNSIKATGNGDLRFFRVLGRDNARIRLVTDGSVLNKKNLTSYNTDTNKSHSVMTGVGKLVLNGEVGLIKGSESKHLMSKLTEAESFGVLCTNLFLYLQKSILSYTMINSENRVREYEVEVHQMRTNDINTGARFDHMINIEKFSDEELDVLMVGLMGNDSVSVRYCGMRGDNIDIFSLFDVDPITFFLIGESDASDKRRRRRRISGDFVLYPPEKTLSLIMSIVQKLNAIEDWGKVCRSMRGMSSFALVLSEFLGEGDGDYDNLKITIPFKRDNSTGTIFREVQEGYKSIMCMHTNLQASSANLLVEGMVGKYITNNIHYIAEGCGINSSKLGRYTLGESLMLEFGNGDFLDVDTMSQLLFNCITENVRMTPFVIFELIKYYREDYIGNMRSKMWLQANLLTGEVLGNNITGVVDGKVHIIGGGDGPMVTSRNSKEYTSAWLYMHNLSDEQWWDYGMSEAGMGFGYRVLKRKDACNYMEGTYQLTYVSLSLGKDSHIRGRSGNDTVIGENLFRFLTYISTNLIDNGRLIKNPSEVERVIREVDDRQHDPDSRRGGCRNTEYGNTRGILTNKIDKEYIADEREREVRIDGLLKKKAKMDERNKKKKFDVPHTSSLGGASRVIDVDGDDAEASDSVSDKVLSEVERWRKKTLNGIENELMDRPNVEVDDEDAERAALIASESGVGDEQEEHGVKNKEFNSSSDDLYDGRWDEMKPKDQMLNPDIRQVKNSEDGATLTVAGGLRIPRRFRVIATISDGSCSIDSLAKAGKKKRTELISKYELGENSTIYRDDGVIYGDAIMDGYVAVIIEDATGDGEKVVKVLNYKSRKKQKIRYFRQTSNHYEVLEPEVSGGYRVRPGSESVIVTMREMRMPRTMGLMVRDRLRREGYLVNVIDRDRGEVELFVSVGGEQDEVEEADV
jgi:hypothetical protein